MPKVTKAIIPAAGFGTLKQAVITLGIKQPFLSESGFLEAMVHVGGQDEIVFVPDDFKEL